MTREDERNDTNNYRLSKEELKKELFERAAFVSFYKKNRTRRDLFGTTNTDIIRLFGEDKLPKQKQDGDKMTNTLPPEGFFSVFDLEAEGWRSFWYNDGLIEAEPFDPTELLKRKGLA